MDRTLVFVYGTLRKGFGNHRLLKDAKFIGNAKTVDKYCMTASGIPFVHKKPALTRIVGEVYEVNRQQLERLDMLESHPTWYKRELTAVELEDGRTVKAWLYFNENSRAENIVEDGDYANHRHVIYGYNY